MKKFRMKTYLLLTLILGVFILPGCSGDAGNGHWDKPSDSIGLVSVVITPAAATIPIDGFQPFTATATYEDGSSVDVTTSSIWSSGNPAIATISPTTGVAEGITAGTGVVITATFGGMSTTSLLTVTGATLTSIVVTPALATIPVNGTQQFIATANYSDASTLDVTAAPGTVWTAANVPLGGAAVASLSANGSPGAGLATGVVVGTSEITATYRTLSDTAALDVTNVAVTIIPGAVCPISSPTTPTATMSDPTDGLLFVLTSTSGVVGGGKQITVTFDMAMDAATINDTTFTLTPQDGVALVPASVTYDALTNVATLTTSAALEVSTTYGVSISTAVTSATGVAIACPYEWTFKTTDPAAVGAAPIKLGLAESFGIAATGGVTNTSTAPITHIDGDVVLNPNATCNGVEVDHTGGFGLCDGMAPTINGTVITNQYPDTTTAQAVTDALRATYLSITPANLPGGTSIAAGTTLGAPIGDALVEGVNLFYPGVYTADTSILITGDLTLDARGDANATFVFQSASTVGTAPGARILLAEGSGAKASNIWWQAGSAATLQTNTVWQGNILAYDDVTMVTGATSCGRLFAGAFTDGAFTFDSNVVSVPGHPSAPIGCE